MRGEVVVGQVVEEEVEAVAGHEPAPDRGGIGVDRAGRAAEDRDRGAGHVRLEKVVEEEALRPEGRAGETREQRAMAGAPAVAGDVHGGRRQARVLERLVDRHRLRPEVLLVHVEDGVEDRAPGAGSADRGERGAVLDDTLLGAVVPDEVGDVVHVRVRAGCDRRQADRGQRREGGDAAAVAPVRGQEGERGRRSSLDRVLEDIGREAVDDDEDELLSRGQDCGGPHNGRGDGASRGRRGRRVRRPRGNRRLGRRRAPRGRARQRG